MMDGLKDFGFTYLGGREPQEKDIEETGLHGGNDKVQGEKIFSSKFLKIIINPTILRFFFARGAQLFPNQTNPFFL